MDLLEKLFFEDSALVVGRNDFLHNSARLVMMKLTADPIRKLLLGGKRVRGNDGPRVYGLSQFAGACETVMAGTRLMMAGYPYEVPTLARRAFETGAVGLYYIDKPGVWQKMVNDGPKKRLSEVVGRHQSPKIGSVLQNLWTRCRELGNPQGLKRLYDRLSDHAHSAPGVRAMANFQAVDRLRLGPLDPHDDQKPFETAQDMLVHIAEALGFIVWFAYKPELLEAVEAGEDGPLDPGNLADLVELGARAEGSSGGEERG